MDCKHVNEHLMDYLYQELDADHQEQIEGHLRGCDGCTHELEAFESTRKLMLELPELAPPGALTTSLIRAAAHAVEPAPPGILERISAGLRMMVMHPAMTAAVVLVLVLGVSFYAYRQSSPPSLKPKADELTPVPHPVGTVAAGKELEGAAGATEQVAQAPDHPVVDPEAAVDTQQLRKDQPANAVGDLAKAPAKVTLASRGAGRRKARRPRRSKPRPKPAAKPMRYRKGPSRAYKQEAAPPKKPGTVADNDDLFANAYGGKSGSLKGAPTPQVAVTKSKDSASSWLQRAEVALKKGDCRSALRYYDRALRTRPDLRKKIGPSVERCVGVLARGGEGELQKAQKIYPRLAGWLEAEISKARRRRAHQQNIAKKTEKKKAKKAGPRKVDRKATSIDAYSAPAAD
jgi:hypothetical protein